MRSLRDLAADLIASALGCLDKRYGDALDVLFPGDDEEPEPHMEDRHNEWTLRIYDDQPILEGRKYAADQRVVLLRDGKQVREFLYPGYRIWTLLAHWTEGLAELDLVDERSQS